VFSFFCRLYNVALYSVGLSNQGLGNFFAWENQVRGEEQDAPHAAASSVRASAVKFHRLFALSDSAGGPAGSVGSVGSVGGMAMLTLRTF